VKLFENFRENCVQFVSRLFVSGSFSNLGFHTQIFESQDPYAIQVLSQIKKIEVLSYANFIADQI
jgi:hypothetical protein